MEVFIRRAYRLQRHHSKQRNIPFLLTFEEWSALWVESGKWEQRGRLKGQYVMARFGDQGAYEVGNVRICLAEENRAERNRNYPNLEIARIGAEFWSAASDEYRADHGRQASENLRKFWQTASAEYRAEHGQQVGERLRGVPKSAAHRAAISKAARERRTVIRDGRRAYVYPGDPDYPI